MNARGRLANRSRQPGRPAPGPLLAGLLVLPLLACAGPPATAPDWIASAGASAAHPSRQYLTGYAEVDGGAGVEAAKSAAAGALATKISVRIEHELRDVSAERDGEYSYHVAAITRTTADVHLTGLRYEVHRQSDRLYALAILDRRAEAERRRRLRDDERLELRVCLEAGAGELEAGRRSAALETYAGCRKPLADALEHEAVARVLVAAGPSDRAATEELVRATRQIDEGEWSALRQPAASLSDGLESMALQLRAQGVPEGVRIGVTPFTYGATDLASEFGRQIAQDLEVALARGNGHSSEATPHLALRGFYRERDDDVTISAVVKDAQTRRLVASAEASVPRASLPDGVELVPPNFASAMSSHGVLSSVLASGDLQLEFWTDKGRRGLVYAEGELLTLYFRVNAPAWVRIVYVLANGAQVVIEQALRVGPDRTNRVIEYPDAFAVVPPFGVEYFHVSAFRESPTPLATRSLQIEGQPYDVLARGMDSFEAVRREMEASGEAFAEAFVAVTTVGKGDG
ncbi:MAG: hypothetical protein QNK03_19335 [Myxococcota bacterium]|nr:hypothetical protein [Myxococcota bacterium]